VSCPTPLSDAASLAHHQLLLKRVSYQILHMLQDSDLNGVVDVRYTGGARMLLLIELGRRKSKMRIKV
jgi:hypothetical protein